MTSFLSWGPHVGYYIMHLLPALLLLIFSLLDVRLGSFVHSATIRHSLGPQSGKTCTLSVAILNVTCLIFFFVVAVKNSENRNL